LEELHARRLSKADRRTQVWRSRDRELERTARKGAAYAVPPLPSPNSACAAARRAIGTR
jgi:hypothetical protein